MSLRVRFVMSSRRCRALSRACGASSPERRRRATARGQIRGWSATPDTRVELALLIRLGPLHESLAVMNIPHNILVPIDLDDSSAQVLDYAVALAAKLDAKLHVFHAVPWPLMGAEVPIAVIDTAMDELMKRGRKVCDEIVGPHTAKLPPASASLKKGDARAAILAAAKELPADLIVIGTP